MRLDERYECEYNRFRNKELDVDQFLLDTQPEKDTKRRQLDALLDDMSDTGIRIVTATAKEIAEVENEN